MVDDLLTKPRWSSVNYFFVVFWSSASLCFLSYPQHLSAVPVCSLILLFSWPESSPLASLLILKLLHFASALAQRHPWFLLFDTCSTEGRWSCCPGQCCGYLTLTQLHEDTLSLSGCDFLCNSITKGISVQKLFLEEVLRYAYAAWEIQISFFVLFLHFSLSNCCPYSCISHFSVYWKFVLAKVFLLCVKTIITNSDMSANCLVSFA